jgi:hypothetical protein
MPSKDGKAASTTTAPTAPAAAPAANADAKKKSSKSNGKKADESSSDEFYNQLKPIAGPAVTSKSRKVAIVFLSSFFFSNEFSMFFCAELLCFVNCQFEKEQRQQAADHDAEIRIQNDAISIQV